MITIRYGAFLRGINVGGHKIVPMQKLTKTFEDLGFTNVKTILNSGNVIFETNQSHALILKNQISETLEKVFGFPIPILIRSSEEIQELIAANPFEGIIVTPQTRLYVTFLEDSPKNTLPIPYESPEKDFQILKIVNHEVCSVLTVSPQRNTTDVMRVLEKEFGKNVTTRNWNTVKKFIE